MNPWQCESGRRPAGLPAKTWAAQCRLGAELAAASWRRSPGPMTSWLEAEMLCEKTKGHASYTNAQCENANVKLDSPQSESDRGESQLYIGNTACWLHIFHPSHWIGEKR